MAKKRTAGRIAIEPTLERPLRSYRIVISQTSHADILANDVDLEDDGILIFRQEYTPDSHTRVVAGFKEWITFLESDQLKVVNGSPAVEPSAIESAE
jgi:hypothetical protein